MENTETDGLKATDLRTVDGGVISIIRAVCETHKKDGDDDYSRRKISYITSNGEEIATYGAYDVTDFNEFRDTVADVTFRILDEPSAGMWPITAAELLCHAKVAVAQEKMEQEIAKAEAREAEAA